MRKGMYRLFTAALIMSMLAGNAAPAIVYAAEGVEEEMTKTASIHSVQIKKVKFEKDGSHQIVETVPFSVEHGKLLYYLPSYNYTTGFNDFYGFYTNEECTVPFNIYNDVIMSDTVIYQRTTSTGENVFANHKVTFYMNDGSGEVYRETGSDSSGNNYIIRVDSSAATRSGYHFAGWYAEPEGINRVGNYWPIGSYPSGGTVEGLNVHTFQDVDLYAKWVPVTASFTVNMHLNDGSGAVVSRTVWANQNVPDFTPARDGFVFEGWYLDPECTEEYSGKVLSDLNLYANWVGGYKHTFYMNDGTDAIWNTKYVDAGTPISGITNEPVREDYDFTGWYLDSDCTKTAGTYASAADTVLYAGWREKTKVTVKFYLNNGTDTIIKTVEDQKGRVLYSGYVPKPVRTGYTLTGWYTDKECVNSFDIANEPINSSMSLYAGWQSDSENAEKTYEINFWENKSSTQNSLITNTVTAGQPIGYTGSGFIANPSSDTYKYFRGWYLEPECITPVNIYTTKATSNMDLYGGWKGSMPGYVDGYNIIKYYMNDGTDELYQVTSVLAAETVSTPTVKREGYKHTGWYLDKECTLPITNKDYATSNMDLYAGWEEDASATSSYYSINAIKNMGDPSGSNYNSSVQNFSVPKGESIRSKNPYFLSNPPTWTGYTLLGWFYDRDAQQPVDLDAPVNRDIKIYAGWEKEKADGKVVVTYHADTSSSSSVTTEELDKGSEITYEPTKYKYVFGGWYTDTYLQNKFTGTVENDIHLYAKWYEETSTVTYYWNKVDNPKEVYKTLTVNCGDYAEAYYPEMYQHNFLGWYTEQRCINEFDVFNTPITENLTLYAGWEYDESVQSGTGGSGNTTHPEEKPVVPEEPDEGGDTTSGNRIPDSKENVEYYPDMNTDEVYAGANKKVEVYVSQGQTVAVRLPFKATLNGAKGEKNDADYEVVVKANISGADTVKVVPDTEFEMTTVGKNPIQATVTQDQTEFSILNDGEDALELGKTVIGNIEVHDLSAGRWEGIFGWEISVEGNKTSDSEESTN